MQKIIFLDIDGVLNVISADCGPRDEFGSQFHPHLVENLRYIIENTGAGIVISSTWRYSGLAEMQRMWQMRGLPGEVLDITPSAREVLNNDGPFYTETICRGEEIQYWLDRSAGVKYCIIDDDSDMLSDQMKRFVRTSGNYDHSDHIEGYGLTRECAEHAIDILMLIPSHRDL